MYKGQMEDFDICDIPAEEGEEPVQLCRCGELLPHGKKHCSHNCYRRDWRDGRKDIINSQSRALYHKDPEKAVARVTKYNKENKEKRSIYGKEYNKKNAGKILVKQKKWINNNKDKVKIHEKRKYIKQKHKITLEEYEERLKKQNGKCAICGGSKKMALDHCHKSGKLREFLCIKCNVAIGNLNDDVELLKKAIDYIIKHK